MKKSWSKTSTKDQVLIWEKETSWVKFNQYFVHFLYTSGFTLLFGVQHREYGIKLGHALVLSVCPSRAWCNFVAEPEKLSCQMLCISAFALKVKEMVKLTPGLNFIIILLTALDQKI